MTDSLLDYYNGLIETGTLGENWSDYEHLIDLFDKAIIEVVNNDLYLMIKLIITDVLIEFEHVSKQSLMFINSDLLIKLRSEDNETIKWFVEYIDSIKK